MTYVELLKEHAAAEGITHLNSFGHGDILRDGQWFYHGPFVGDPEQLSQAICDVLTGPFEDISHLDL
jgi:hypothetical protein